MEEVGERATDAAQQRMEFYENYIQSLGALELIHILEEMTLELALCTNQCGDYQRQMIVKRVIIRKINGV